MTKAMKPVSDAQTADVGELTEECAETCERGAEGGAMERVTTKPRGGALRRLYEKFKADEYHHHYADTLVQASNEALKQRLGDFLHSSHEAQDPTNEKTTP